MRAGIVNRSPQRFAPRPVDRPVDDDPVQPGAEGAAPVEAVERVDRGEEGVLGDVLSGGAVVDDQVGRAVRASPVGGVEIGERLARSALGLAPAGGP